MTTSTYAPTRRERPVDRLAVADASRAALVRVLSISCNRHRARTGTPCWELPLGVCSDRVRRAGYADVAPAAPRVPRDRGDQHDAHEKVMPAGSPSWAPRSTSTTDPDWSGRDRGNGARRGGR
ncbi:hypothetical protein [Raineyella sp. LH-20]|uniref:hypothetical protein n=1 Tax=Raineyella sp. LH-20 TaxID=3081204 RepID=UPI002952A6BD|nr:hypothetical protein [Raineyella sp. LH-20]WOP17404.1 hypothetical protein R0146_08925 [Raineyella sp. LH-20]